MTRLNLLPWREMRQKEIDRQVLTGAIGAWVIMGAIVVLGYIHVNALIDNQKQRNVYLQGEINKVNKQIAEIGRLKKKRSELKARMEVIFRLQADRTQIVHMFDELVRKLPEGMYLTSLIQKGQNIVVNGRAQSNARVAAFMRSLESSGWFELPDLDVINIANSKGGDRISKFSLRIKRAVKKEAEKDKGGRS